jgi:hypothetical protein
MDKGSKLGNRRRMALADIPGNTASRRLDSWKEIAEYLGRDVRTATRWEAQGLPLHRVPGGKGTSVFAYTHEIDAWMAGPRSRASGALPPAPPPAAPSSVEPGPPPAMRRAGPAAIAAVAALALMATGAAAVARLAPAPLDPATLRAVATQTEVHVADASGTSRSIHYFKPGAQLISIAGARLEDLDRDGVQEVLLAVSNYTNQEARSIEGGEVLAMETTGGVRWRFAFDDAVSFASREFAGPWAFVDLQVRRSAAPSLVAVAAHDFVWWGALVAVLDNNGHRKGTFVNPGWIESVLWLESNRLAIGGFNNLRDEAVLALLDAEHLDGQAPGGAGTPYACTTCPPGSPLFYATFARSELNRVTASRFNRGRVSTLNDRILLTTSETGTEYSEVNAIYEFDRDLRLLTARYSDRYWDEHRRLELEGRISHTREACPDRDGPAAIHVWSGTEWTRIPTTR